MDDIAIAAICSAIVAICQFGGTISTNRRIREVHDCLHEVHETVKTVAVTADARDVRNVGSNAILSGETPTVEAPHARPGT